MKTFLAMGVILVCGPQASAMNATLVLEQAEIRQGTAAIGYIELSELRDDQLCHDFRWTTGQAGFRIRHGDETRDIACKSLHGCDCVSYTYVNCLPGGTVRIPLFLWICRGEFIFAEPGAYSVEFWMDHRGTQAVCRAEVGVTECRAFAGLQRILESAPFPPSMFLAFFPSFVPLDDFRAIGEESEYWRFLVEEVAFYAQRIDYVKVVLLAADTGEMRELPGDAGEYVNFARDDLPLTMLHSEIVSDFSRGLSMYAGTAGSVARPYRYFLLG